jgi:hypothetical protein
MRNNVVLGIFLTLGFAHRICTDCCIGDLRATPQTREIVVIRDRCRQVQLECKLRVQWKDGSKALLMAWELLEVTRLFALSRAGWRGRVREVGLTGARDEQIRRGEQQRGFGYPCQGNTSDETFSPPAKWRHRPGENAGSFQISARGTGPVGAECDFVGNVLSV